MSKNEIRLRRQRMGSHRAERYRNYGAVLQRHEKDVRLKKMLRVFIMFLITLIIIVLLVIVIRVENRARKEEKAWTTTPIEMSHSACRDGVGAIHYPV